MKVKTLNRIGSVSVNALRQVLVSVFAMAVPFMVIHFFSKDSWAGFVPVLLYSLLATHIGNWGNKEYQLRQFSNAPAKMKSHFSSALLARLPLVVVFGALACMLFGTATGMLVFVWLLGRFGYHAVEPILFFEQKFGLFLLIEIGCFLFFCAGIFVLGQNDHPDGLLLLYSFYQLLRGAVCAFVFREYFSFGSLTADFGFFARALPFFLLSMMGFLTSKADVYFVQFFCDRLTTAHYQIINGLFVFIMSVAAFIYAPFTKNIYRNNSSVIRQYQKILGLSGLAVVPLGLVFCYLVIEFYLGLTLGFWFYVLAFVYVYPSYLYGIQIVDMFRKNKERLVILYLFCCALTNMVFSGLLLSLGYGMTGALSACCLSQIMALYLFCLKEKKQQ